jgi:mono/diheme cytochrome c family protein
MIYRQCVLHQAEMRMHREIAMRSLLCLLIILICIVASSQPTFASSQPPALTARVVAVGIAGAGAVAPVGTFHPGGPIRDKPEFFAFSQPGRILDAKRVLVASSSNFGALRAQQDEAGRSILSIDPEGTTIMVPSRFVGGQASALDGRVQLFTAQSARFLNSVTSPNAASASQPSQSNPLGISINNAFGRLWFTSAPKGAQGIGLDSIIDPGGMPLAGAPSKVGGGVFAGDITNRPQQIVPGDLHAPAIANTFVGMSPDGSKRAVFVILTADGALVQAHAEFAVDGVAPAKTITPIKLPSAADASRARITRTGMIFNWVPDRILFITEPERNAVTALSLGNDDKVFRFKSKRTFTAPELSTPVDLTPVVPEVANPGFASNTTLAGNSDFYVANRGNGTIVRMRQDGTVVAVRRVMLPNRQAVGTGRLNGIAVSPDAQKIWVTVSGTIPSHPNAPGVLLELPAFGTAHAEMRNQPTYDGRTATAGDTARDLITQGAKLFVSDFTPAQGLGPLYNRPSCVLCHGSPTTGGMGWDGLGVVHRVGRFENGLFDPLVGAGGPVARDHSIAEFGIACDLVAGPPARANLISIRNAPPLYGLGLIDAIPDAVIRAGATASGAGRPNIVRDALGNERVGRFGWKADTATLEQFVGEAFRNELGITNPIAPTDLVSPGSGCGGQALATQASAPQASATLDDDGSVVRAVTAYIGSMPPPPSKVGPQHRAGQLLFSTIGCAACHTPTLPANGIDVPLYSDLLLHDLGPAMDDRVVQGEATGKDWRTTPLWGLGMRSRLLHDGRATNVPDAILAHDGEAAAASEAFRQLTWHERAWLLAFLLAL